MQAARHLWRGPMARPETPTPKDDLSIKVHDELGHVVLATDDPHTAAAAATMLGVGTEVWMNGERIATCRRGFRNCRPLAEIIAERACEIQQRVTRYRKRIERSVALAT